MMGRPDSGRQGITALTLSWESCDFLPRLIESTLQWADRFYILDTGSTDGSREYLHERFSTDSRLRYFTVDTDHTTFNRGRCINLILDQIDNDDVRSDWYAVIDCDEIFEDDFVEYSLALIKSLPSIYDEEIFQRPTLWYSDSLARAHDIRFHEPAFQRYRGGFRYPEQVFHMSRSMHQSPVRFISKALLLNYELRDPRRSRIQFERLRLIDKDWNHLLESPNDPPELVRITPLRDRGGEKHSNWRGIMLDLLRRRIRSLPKDSKTRLAIRSLKHSFTGGQGDAA